MSTSIATLKRLPQYLRILRTMQKDGIENASSTMLAEILHLNPIQVRKDLAQVYVGKGKPKIGFNVSSLINDIEEFLELNETKNVIIVGAGRLGQALMNSKQFGNAINIVMAFDNDKRKCNDKTIMHIEKLESFIKDTNVHIAVITTPKESAQSICDRLVSSGIKAIWNFAPVSLNVPNNVKVKNEDLSASILILIKSLDK